MIDYLELIKLNEFPVQQEVVAGESWFVITGPDGVGRRISESKLKEYMEGKTDFSMDDFYEGYINAQRKPYIFEKGEKDIIVTDSGSFTLFPETQVGHFIFVGEVDELRGFGYALPGREIKHTNHTGRNIVIRNKYAGSSNTGYDFGGSDYTFVNGSTITFKSNGGFWQLAPNNQIAFSDHLDSVSSTDTVLPVNVILKTNIINPHTLKPVGYRSVDTFIDGSPMDDSFVDGLMYQKLGSKYFANVNFLNGTPVNVRDFGAKGDGITDDTTAIQNAFLFAKETSIISTNDIGRGVYFPSGTYKVTDTIEMYHSCYICGDGRKITVIKSELTGNDKHVFEFLNTGLSYAGVSVRSLSVVGAGSGASEGYAFRLNNSSVNTFNDIEVSNLGGGALWLTGGYVNWVKNCYFGFNGRNSFYSTEDGTQDYAVIYVPRIGTGNSLQVTDCYISNNTTIDGIHFVGQACRLRNCTTESGQRLIVIGEYGTATRVISIDTCYFEAPRKYGIDIRQAQEVMVTNSYHFDSTGNTIASVKIGTLSNARFEGCNFGQQGIEVDRTNGNRVRSNVVFDRCFGVDFNGGDHSLSGIKVLNNLEYNNASGGFGLSKNLWRASDDLTEWDVAGSPTITQDTTFLDGRPAYSMISTTAQAIFVNITGVTVGEKLCFSFYIKGTSSSYIRFRGARVSDGVQEDFAGIRVATASGQWERHFISATATDHSGTITARITTNSSGASVCRAQLERGVLSPSIPIYTNGVGTVASNNIQGVTNGDHYVSGGIVKSSVDGSLWRETLDNSGNKILEKWVSNAWVIQTSPSIPTILSTTATLDFPTIAAGESQQLTVTVTGAALLDDVRVAAPAQIYNTNGATVDGWVSAANTVTVRVRNNGVSSIDPGSGDFKLKVFK